MSKASPTNSSTCCENHDGPHVHGCQRGRSDGIEHAGTCITDPTAAANQDAADEARCLAIADPPRVAWIQVGLDDDSGAVPYPRPNVLEIIAAHQELKNLDATDQLPVTVAAQVRVLLAMVGRLSGDGIAEAFPPPPEPRHLSLVDASGDMS